jgi:hypothetical protein
VETPAPANSVVPEAEAASKPAASEAPTAAEATAVDESKAAAPEIVEKGADADVLFAAEESQVDGDAPATEAPPAVEAVVDKEAEQESKTEGAKAEAEVPRVDSPDSEKREAEEKPAANGHLDEDAGEEKKDEEEDHEAYVGDVTWEERTWKELVRLREDMFWARIGAARS